MSTGGEGKRWASGTLQEIWDRNSAAREALLREVRGLSESQLGFQPVPGKWSIGEILDHLALAEQSMARVALRILQQAAGRGLIGDPGSMEELSFAIDLKAYDAAASAPESVRPRPERPLQVLLTGLWESRERLLEVSRRADGRMIGALTIRHVQLGELHFYQWLTLEAAHEKKHLAQIRAIKAHPKFPRS